MDELGDGPSEQIALGQIQSLFEDHSQIGLRIQAFGHDLGAGLVDDVLERPQKLKLYGIQAHALDEVPVDLHILWSDLGPQPEERKAFA